MQIKKGKNRLSSPALKRIMAAFTCGTLLGSPFSFGSPEITVTELMYNPPGNDTWESSELEFIELRNVGDETADLSGASFSDGITYTFPSGATLAPSSYLVLASNAAALATRYEDLSVYGEYEGQLANSGETVILSDSEGTEIFSLSYLDSSPWPTTADGGGKSLVRTDESVAISSSDSYAEWRASTELYGSPGSSDPALDILPVYVNEILAHTDLPQVDSVELYNPNDEAVDIGNWYLSDNYDSPFRYQIPTGTSIAAQGYLVLDEEDFGIDVLGEELGFRFDSHGEEVWLFSANSDGDLTGFIHGFEFPASENGVSFGRYVDSQDAEFLVAQSELTLGAQNAGPQIGPIVISEILYAAGSENLEFIELRNISSESVPLFNTDYPEYSWTIEAVGYTFPTGLTLAAGQSAIVSSLEPSAFKALYGELPGVLILGPFAGSLNNAGESIELKWPDKPDTLDTGEIYVPYIDTDIVSYSPSSPWPEIPSAGGYSITKTNDSLFGREVGNWILSDAPGSSPGLPSVRTYDSWSLAQFTTAEISDGFSVGGADFDGDFLDNLWEYALQLDPREAEANQTAPLSLSLIETSLYINVPDSLLDLPTDLALSLEQSSDLQNWAPTEFPSQFTSENGTSALGPLPADATLASPFLRLKLSLR